MQEPIQSADWILLECLLPLYFRYCINSRPTYSVLGCVNTYTTCDNTQHYRKCWKGHRVIRELAQHPPLELPQVLHPSRPRALRPRPTAVNHLHRNMYVQGERPGCTATTDWPLAIALDSQQWAREVAKMLRTSLVHVQVVVVAIVSGYLARVRVCE